MFKALTTIVKGRNLDFEPDLFSILPRELSLKILFCLEPKDILTAEQVCKNWRFICNDDFLWQDKCKKDQITITDESHEVDQNECNEKSLLKKGNFKVSNGIYPSSDWKCKYIRQRRIEANWRSQSIKNSKSFNCDYELVSCLRLNTKYIASSSYDTKIINIFLINTGKCIKKLMGHADFITTFNLSEKLIISGSNDKTLKIWCVDTGENYRTLLGHTESVRCLTVYEKKVVSGSSDCSIRIWNYERGVCLHVLSGHSGAVHCVEYNGLLVISGSSDKTIKIWRPEEQLCVKTLEGHKHEVKSLQFDGTNIVSGSLDSVRIWDINTGCLKQTLLNYKNCFAFTSYSNTDYKTNLFAFIYFYSPFPYYRVRYEIKICESATGQCVQILSDPSEESSQIQCIQFVLNFVLTSSFGNTIKLWDIKTGKFLRNVLNLNSFKDGYVQKFRATETTLVCLTEEIHLHQKKFIVINFDTNTSMDCKFMKNTVKDKDFCNIV